MPLSPHESALLSRIKEHQDNAAIVELVNLHTGVYQMVATKYSKTYPNIINLHDLTDDRLTNIYKWVIDYKDDRDTQLGTYIGQRTDYLCRWMLKKAKHDPLSAGTTLSSLSNADQEQDAVTYLTGAVDNFETESHTTGGKNVFIVDKTDAARPADAANRDVGIEDIMKAIDDPSLGLDPRFRVILQQRHLINPIVTWRAIGKGLGISHEMARKIYMKNMDVVKKKLGGGTGE